MYDDGCKKSGVRIIDSNDFTEYGNKTIEVCLSNGKIFTGTVTELGDYSFKFYDIINKRNCTFSYKAIISITEHIPDAEGGNIDN